MPRATSGRNGIYFESAELEVNEKAVKAHLTAIFQALRHRRHRVLDPRSDMVTTPPAEDSPPG